MKKFSTFVLAGVAGLLLSGCASYVWTPGPDATGTYDEASARCSLMARSGGSGFYAQGSPRFVAAASLGNVLGEALRTQADFNDCMKATGWVGTKK